MIAFRVIVPALALGLGLSLSAAAVEPPPDWDSSRYMSIDEVRPGMTGTGRSVFRGTEIEEFDAEILGVLKSATPRGDIILARLSGQNLDHSGVVAGMSGSPIYVDGRLVGALAYGWSFSSEPITGITPIAEMLRLQDRFEAAPGGETQWGSGAGPGSVPWEQLWEARGSAALDLVTATDSRGGADLTPLRVPVSLAGFDPAAADEARGWLEGLGFVAVQGGGAGADPEAAFPPLEPGSAVGVELVRGDAQIAAVGTVTWVQDERILAFGHRMMNRGPAAYPMGPARIITVMPRLSESFKFGVMGSATGAVTRDYYAGVMGSVGETARMISMEVEALFGDRQERLQFEILEAEGLTPALAGVVAMNGIRSLGWETGAATISVETAITLEDGRRLQTRSVNAGFTPPRELAGAVARLVGLVHANPFEPARIQDIHIRVGVEKDIRAAFLDLISVPPGPHAPGARVPVTLTLRDYRGSTWSRVTPFRVPADLDAGSYRLTACGAEADGRQEMLRAPGRYQPRSLDHLLELLGSEDPYDTLVLRLLDPEPNPVVNGRELPGLPRSLKAVLLTPVVGGRASATTGGVAATVREKLDRILIGCREVTLSVAPSR